MTSIQDSKPREKQISPTFSYFLINNALLYHFLANRLAHNKKMTEKSVFREAWSPDRGGWPRAELHYGSILQYASVDTISQAVRTSGEATEDPLKSEFLSSFRCKC